jgi:hypothetical protein
MLKPHDSEVFPAALLCKECIATQLATSWVEQKLTGTSDAMSEYFESY